MEDQLKNMHLDPDPTDGVQPPPNDVDLIEDVGAGKLQFSAPSWIRLNWEYSVCAGLLIPVNVTQTQFLSL